MKKIIILSILINLYISGCCQIKYGDVSYIRIGPQEVNNLTFKSPEGYEVSIESLKNTGADDTLNTIKELLK